MCNSQKEAFEMLQSSHSRSIWVWSFVHLYSGKRSIRQKIQISTSNLAKAFEMFTHKLALKLHQIGQKTCVEYKVNQVHLRFQK